MVNLHKQDLAERIINRLIAFADTLAYDELAAGVRLAARVVREEFP